MGVFGQVLFLDDPGKGVPGLDGHTFSQGMDQVSISEFQGFSHHAADVLSGAMKITHSVEFFDRLNINFPLQDFGDSSANALSG